MVCTLCLFLLSNYIIFIAARSTILTFQGYGEIKQLNQEGNYTANIDPSRDMKMDAYDYDEPFFIISMVLHDQSVDYHNRSVWVH